ncbi:MAG: energy transducer TonB [Bacteroidota bacterium]
MEVKKTTKADLNRKSGLFFHLGLIISIGLVISAFEWKTKKIERQVQFDIGEGTEITYVPSTVIEDPAKPKSIKKLVKPVIVNPVVKTEPETNEPETESPLETISVEVEGIGAYEGGEEVTEEAPFVIVEKMPQPQGFYEHIQKNLKYPKQAKRMRVQGKVFVQFIVEKDGSLSEVEVIRGIGAGCDEEALKVIKSAPKWIPGQQRNENVRVKMIFPLHFELN